MRVAESTSATLDGEASAKAVWASAVAKIDRHLGDANARRKYDELGQVSVGSTDLWLDQNFSISVSGPATFSLSIILDGEFTSCLDGGSPLVITSGSAVVFASQGMISGTNSLRGGQHIRLVDIRFSKSLLENAGGLPLSRFARELFVDRSVPESGTIFIAFPAQASLITVGTQMINCNFDDEGARKLFLQAKSLEALALTIAILGRTQPRVHHLTASDREKLALARQLLHHRFDENWTISSLARAIGIGERKLKEGFRVTVGNSVHAYLKHVRLSAAASMLSEGRSVTDVALSVGFENLSHFSKSFRELHGINPSSYSRNSSR
ncbi:MAG: helix-turn-helix domain-containing protein [Rhizobiales bacterium]|nr:helix-turn-helix domain-containing protein [Hyphomicrobiales bacterium]